MTELNNEALKKRIIEFFEKIAPIIVVESVASLATDSPIIDLYDEDFYLEKMKDAFTDVEESKQKEAVLKNLEKINDIFLQCYKKAKKPS